jgi:hypothetical protein
MELQISYQNGKTSHIHELEELILLKCPYPQINLQIQCNLHQSTNGFLHRTRKKSQNSYGSTKDPK